MQLVHELRHGNLFISLHVGCTSDVTIQLEQYTYLIPMHACYRMAPHFEPTYAMISRTFLGFHSGHRSLSVTGPTLPSP